MWTHVTEILKNAASLSHCVAFAEPKHAMYDATKPRLKCYKGFRSRQATDCFLFAVSVSSKSTDLIAVRQVH